MTITQELYRLLIAFAVMFLGVQTPVAAPPPTAASAPALTQALRFAPADVRLLQFSDWTSLRAYGGVEKTPAAETARRLPPRARNGEFFIPTGYASQTGAVNRALWGWDFGDLEWESALQLDDGRSAYAMRLRNDYPLDDLLARFAERGFVRKETDDVILLTRAMDQTAPWSVDIAVFNAAVFPDEHVLVHAPAMESVQKVVDAYLGVSPSAAGAPEYQEIAAQLGSVAAAVLGPYAVNCAQFDAAQLLAGAGKDVSPAAVQAALAARFGDAPLGPFLALGVGYGLTDGQPVGRIVLAYPDAASAAADLEPRALIAREGKSLLVDEPVSDLIFTLDSADLAGAAIVLTVTPVDGQPGRLFSMFYNRDMGFAGCMAQ